MDIPSPRAIQRSRREIKLFLTKTPSNKLRAFADPSDSITAPWVKFGDEIVLMSDKPASDELVEESGRVSSELKDIGSVLKRENLHLVVQKGNIFEQENPSIPVLMNRGRFLLIDLEPEEAKKFSISDEPCYSIEPLKDNHIVYEKTFR